MIACRSWPASPTWDDCALNIYSTVVSRAGTDRGILDAGSKTLTSDTGGSRWPRPDPGTSRSQDRALRRRAWLSRSRPQQHPPQHRRRGADRAQSRLRRRQHDGRSADGARRRDHRDAAGGGTGKIVAAKARETMPLQTRYLSVAPPLPPRPSRKTPAADSRRSALPNPASRRRRRRQASAGA